MGFKMSEIETFQNGWFFIRDGTNIQNSNRFFFTFLTHKTGQKRSSSRHFSGKESGASAQKRGRDSSKRKQDGMINQFDGREAFFPSSLIRDKKKRPSSICFLHPLLRHFLFFFPRGKKAKRCLPGKKETASSDRTFLSE